MEKIREFWTRYPRGWADIVGLVSVLAVLAWGLSEPFSGLLDVGLVTRGANYRLMLAIVIVAVGYIVFDLVYYVTRRGSEARVEKDSSACVRSQLKDADCLEVRVFSSGGEDAKIRFLDLSQESFTPRKDVKIKVLLRGNKSSERDTSLSVLVQRWRKDIDEVTANSQSGYRFVTEFSVYELPVMLRGYVFGRKAATLSWYARDDIGIRSSPKMPHILLKYGSANGKVIVEEAVELFDYFFNLGRKL